jgi:metacaspase-1
MSKGVSLHIGVNRVDPAHYNGWSGDLAGCEFDAQDMERIAKSRGYESTLLLTKDATAKNVITGIEDAATKLEEGDIFFLTNSSHGGQVPDTHHEEEDSRDETWVLYDRQLVDDELFALWQKFKPGVRVIVLSDSCHSGTATRDAMVDALVPLLAEHGVVDDEQPRKKEMPRNVEDETYKANKKLYDEIQDKNAAGDTVEPTASVLLISGCQDNQVSLDGARNGLFTQTLLGVWKDGAYRGPYARFHKAIVKKMPPTQTPNLFKVGQPNTTFERQSPFTV